MSQRPSSLSLAHCSLLKMLARWVSTERMYRNNVDKLAEWIPQAERQTISGASHGMNVTHPASFNRLIGAFASA